MWISSLYNKCTQNNMIYEESLREFLFKESALSCSSVICGSHITKRQTRGNKDRDSALREKVQNYILASRQTNAKQMGPYKLRVIAQSCCRETSTFR